MITFFTSVVKEAAIDWLESFACLVKQGPEITSAQFMANKYIRGLHE
jgi:hypothetical protein